MKKSVGLHFCCALAVLVTIAIAAPHPTFNPNLKDIIDIIDNYSKILKEELFVENVVDLTQGHGSCGPKFFCKAEAILCKHWNETRHQQDKVLKANLKVYNEHKNCTEVLKHVKNAPEKIQIPKFLNYIKDCIHCRNLNLSKSSCSD